MKNEFPKLTVIYDWLCKIFNKEQQETLYRLWHDNLTDLSSCWLEAQEMISSMGKCKELEIFPLTSIFTAIKPSEPLYLQPGTQDTFPILNTNAVNAIEMQAVLSSQFIKEVQALLPNNDDDTQFVMYLLRKYFSNIACGKNSCLSVYDNIKLTLALGNCLKNYASKIHNPFLLFYCDLSGIQNFIFTVSTDQALKMLRSRSFYLEVALDSVLHDLLYLFDLSDDNILYTGGGSAYCLLPNTPDSGQRIDGFMLKINQWFMNQFEASLFLSYGFAPCSIEDLKSSGQLSNVYKSINQAMTLKKYQRYQAQDIIKLNQEDPFNAGRECSICASTHNLLDSENRCTFCNSLIRLSSMLNYNAPIIVSSSSDENSVELPSAKGKRYFSISNHYVNDDAERSAKVYYKYESKNYSKTRFNNYAWQNDQDLPATFEDMAKVSQGIKRIAVLRADVDNLGSLFIKGFRNNLYDDFPLGLSMVLSNQLNSFFKQHFKRELMTENPSTYLHPSSKGAKKLVVVYAGGDDVFIAGAWNHVMDAAALLHEKFEQFTSGTLTLSAGVGIFGYSYPLIAMADETADLEAAAKSNPNKNAIALFGKEGIRLNDGRMKYEARHVYNWDTYLTSVIGEKFVLIDKYFKEINRERDTGNSFLFNIMSLVESAEQSRFDKINIARCAFLLSRMAPPRSNKELSVAYRNFADSIYLWISDEKSRMELLTAMMLFIYLNRKTEEGKLDD